MRDLLRLPFALVLLFYQGIALAFSEIWTNKIRGILTTVGILIGIAAVSAVIALLEGMKQRVLGEFEAFGTNKIFISPQWPRTGRTSWDQVCFRNSDFDDLLERCPSVVSYTRDAGYGPIPVSYRTRTEQQKLYFHAVDPQWHLIARRSAEAGRPLTDLDSQHARRVCLINAALRDRLGLNLDPTGQSIRTAYFGRLMIVGMVEQPLAISGIDVATGEVVVPFTFSTGRYNYPTWYSVTASSRSADLTEEAKAEIEFYLRQKRRIKPGEPDTFVVATSQRAIDDIKILTGVVTTIAVGIVGISLLVGGVGIMNIMLVSVSERTREIGLRKAVGARPAAILLQFLIEAVVLCVLGGLLGLIAGQVLTSGVALFLPDDIMAMRNFKPGRDAWSFGAGATRATSILLPPLAIGVAFGFATLVGLIFGMFPAIKAASLDPAEALRHE